MKMKFLPAYTRIKGEEEALKGERGEAVWVGNIAKLFIFLHSP